MSVQDVLVKAINAKVPVLAIYKGTERWICPHRIGYKGMSMNLLSYQYAGHSDSGLGPDGSDVNWRCWNVADVSSVQIVEGEWHSALVVGVKRSTCVDTVLAEVAW